MCWWWWEVLEKAACAVTAIGGNSPDCGIRYVIDMQLHGIEGDWVLQ